MSTTATLGGEHARLLSRVELFSGLDRVTLAKLVVGLESLRVKAGDVIFSQGDSADGLYLICSGTIAICAGDDDMVLSRLRPGEAFGEIALLSGQRRTAGARAEDDAELLRLDQRRFQELVRRDPSVSLAISAGLIRRLRIADAVRLGLPAPIDEIPSAPEREHVGNIAISRRRLFGWFLTTMVLLGGWLAPAPSGLDARAWHALVSLVALVPALALEALPEAAISLLLVAIWVMGGVVSPAVALSGFSTTTWILTTSVFAVGAAVASCGLLYRVALWAVARAAGFRRQVVALGISGLILGAAIPNATGRMSLVASALAELGEALGYETGSPPAVGLAMAGLAGFGLMVAPFLTSSSTGLLALALLPDASKASINWVSWAARAAPLHIVLLGGLLGMILWRYAPTRTAARARTGAPALQLQQALLGRMSRQELVAGAVTLLLLVGFATQPLHGVDPAFVSVIAFIVMAGAGLLTLNTLQSINWNTVLLLGVLGSMTQVVSTTKLDAWIATVLVGALGGLSAAPLVFVAALALLCLGLSLVLRWQAVVPLIVLALGPVASSAGIDPWIVAIVALTAANTFFLPYQSTIYLALYTGGGSRLFHHPQARPFAYAYAALTIVGLLVSVPVWHLMGLL